MVLDLFKDDCNEVEFFLVEVHLDVLVDGSSRMLRVAAIETSPGIQCSFGEQNPEISLGLRPTAGYNLAINSS